MSDNNFNSGGDHPPAGTLPDTFFLPSNSLEATIDFNDVKRTIDNYVKLKEEWHAMRKAFVNAVEQRLNCANCGDFHGYDTDQNSLLWTELFEDIKNAEFGFELFEGDQGGPDKEITLEKVQGWLKKWDEVEELYDKECRGSACGQWLEGRTTTNHSPISRCSEPRQLIMRAEQVSFQSSNQRARLIGRVVPEKRIATGLKLEVSLTSRLLIQTQMDGRLLVLQIVKSREKLRKGEVVTIVARRVTVRM